MKPGILLLLFMAVSAAVAAQTRADGQEICLNGEGWTFQPEKVPFYGYELDAPGRWMTPQRSHRFIVEAIEAPANDWSARNVRVPMSWSGATSDPGSRASAGDFAFPFFWQYVHRGVYERTFEVPARFAGRRVKLRFESVNFRAWIYVNGALVPGAGETGDWTHENKHPFELDVTSFVRAGAPNRLRVVVHDSTASFAGKFPNEDHPQAGITYPLGDRCDYYNKDRGWRNIDSGIIGDVLLRAVPDVNVADVFVRTSVRDGVIEAEVTVRNESPSERHLVLAGRVVEAGSRREELALSALPAVTLRAGERRVLTLRQSWQAPRLWWPHDPFLHCLELSLRDGGAVVARAEQRFGFREVEMVSSVDVDRRGFYLNGVRVRLLGESVEPTWKDSYSEGVGQSGLYLYNPEYWGALLDEAKRLNIRILRLHRGMWLQSMADLADEKGVLLIAATTINNGNHKGGIGTMANQRRAVRDMILSLRNHPAVVFWELANETPFFEEWATEARQHDATRPFVATQTVPRHHPSPSLAAATGSYAMGLSGYEPNIYGRHDANWGPKPMYVYEDNACYDQPDDNDRLEAVQKGLTILRGHRSSGYEIVSTFYTWQKLYGQPRDPGERLLPLHWSAKQTRAKGYRPDFARLPLLDPWTNSGRAPVIRPLSGFTDDPVEFWRRSFSPVAVFDRGFDQRLDVRANPYVAPLAAERTLTIHNDDLEDRSTALRIEWAVSARDGRELSHGGIDLDVPLGGVRQRNVQLDVRGAGFVRVTYRALKSGRERFRETISLSAAVTQPARVASRPTASGGIVLRASDPAVKSKGYRLTQMAGQRGDGVLSADGQTPDAFVEFTPEISESGDYDVYVHVPPGLRGVQSVEVRHDTLNTVLPLDLSVSGWVKLNASPLHMEKGALQNSVRFQNGSSSPSVVDAIRIVRAS